MQKEDGLKHVFSGCLRAKFNSTGPIVADKCVFMVIFYVLIKFQLRVEKFMAQWALLLVCMGTPMDFVLLFLENSLFHLHLHHFHFGLPSGSYTGSSTGSHESSGGAGVPIDLVCLCGTGDPHGNSGLYTRSLSDSCLDVNGLGVHRPTRFSTLKFSIMISTPPPQIHQHNVEVCNQCIFSHKPDTVFC